MSFRDGEILDPDGSGGLSGQGWMKARESLQNLSDDHEGNGERLGIGNYSAQFSANTTRGRTEKVDRDRTIH
jgi:hypothetical protein